MKNLKRGTLALSFLIALLLGGCSSDSEDKAKAITDLINECNQPGATAKLTGRVGSWNGYVEFTCEWNIEAQ